MANLTNLSFSAMTQVHGNEVVRGWEIPGIPAVTLENGQTTTVASLLNTARARNPALSQENYTFSLGADQILRGSQARGSKA